MWLLCCAPMSFAVNYFLAAARSILSIAIATHCTSDLLDSEVLRKLSHSCVKLGVGFHVLLRYVEAR
jgi:hypothetical protein